jgi:transposase InsO family protein
LPPDAAERWRVDFVSHALGDGRKFRALTLVDDCTRECPAIEVDTSLPGERVVRVLDRVAGARGYPDAIVCDNGPEFRGEALDQWPHRYRVQPAFIEPGKPVQNAYIESFNGKSSTDKATSRCVTAFTRRAFVLIEGHPLGGIQDLSQACAVLLIQLNPSVHVLHFVSVGAARAHFGIVPSRERIIGQALRRR